MDYNQKQIQYALIIRGQKPIILNSDPSGWENTLISVKRSPFYYGTIRSFTVPMDFVKEGATYLRREFYTYGIQADVQLQVNLLNSNTFVYQTTFTGKLDFSNCKDYGKMDGYKFTCNVMQADISSLIAAYESTVFEIPLPDNPVFINLQGLTLNETATSTIGMGTGTRSVNFFPAISITQNQINSTKPSSRSTVYNKQTAITWTNSDEFFFKSLIAGNLNLTGSLGFSISGGGTFTIQVRRDDAPGTIVGTIFTVTKPDRTETPYQIGFNLNIPVDLGEAIYIYFYWNNDGPLQSADGYYIQGGTMTASYNTISPPSTIKAMRVYDLYYALIQKINSFSGVVGFNYPVQSYYLQNTWKQLCVTSGDAFRPDLNTVTYYNTGDALTAGLYYNVISNGFGNTGTVLYNGITYNIGQSFKAVPTAKTFTATGFAEVSNVSNPAIIKTSFKDFFQSMNSLLNCGFGDLNGIATLEQKNYFFQTDLVTETLNDIQKFELMPFLDYLNNTIKGGYPDQTYDVVNGRLEINSATQYSTPINKVQKELNLQSVYRADVYGMEFLRIQLGGNTTKGDNDVFLIKVRANPEAGQLYYQPEGAEHYLNVTGVEPGYYNMDITPKKNLLRHSDYLAGMLYQIEGSIKLSAALKSIALSTISSSGQLVSESTDIDIASLPKPMFIPYTMNISSDAPSDLVQALANFPNGAVTILKDNNNYFGFIIDAGADPSQNKEQTRNLLLTNRNNLLNLVV